jgi:hypothetical protein
MVSPWLLNFSWSTAMRVDVVIGIIVVVPAGGRTLGAVAGAAEAGREPPTSSSDIVWVPGAGFAQNPSGG